MPDVGRTDTGAGSGNAPDAYRTASTTSTGASSYEPLLVEICKFFKTGKPPVSAEETLEIAAFMTAAAKSMERGGAPVTLADVMAQARQQIGKKSSR